MKIQSVTVEWTQTVKPADYESKKCGLVVQAQIEDGDDVRVVTDRLMVRVRERVQVELGLISRPATPPPAEGIKSVPLPSTTDWD